jgi:hypothetical protein
MQRGVVVEPQVAAQPDQRGVDRVVVHGRLAMRVRRSGGSVRR